MNVEIQITYVLILNHVGFSYVINSVEAGLCNATGSFYIVGDGSANIGISCSSPSGVFYAHVTGRRDGYVTSSNTNKNWGISFSLKNSNNLFGKSNTVTPLSYSTKFFIKF